MRWLSLRPRKLRPLSSATTTARGTWWQLAAAPVETVPPVTLVVCGRRRRLRVVPSFLVVPSRTTWNQNQQLCQASFSSASSASSTIFSTQVQDDDEEDDLEEREKEMTKVRYSLLQESRIQGMPQLQAAVDCIAWYADRAIAQQRREAKNINNEAEEEEEEEGKSNDDGGSSASSSSSSPDYYLQIATDLFDHVNCSTYDMTWRRGSYPRATAAYNAILRAWQVLVDHNGRRRVSPEAKFDELKRIAARKDNDDEYETYFPLNNESFGILMDAALEDSPRTTTTSEQRQLLPEFCEAVLRRMTTHPAKGIGDARWPDANTFARCYLAWSQSGLPEASERAYTLFLTQKELARMYHSARVNERCIVALLRALLAAPPVLPPRLERPRQKNVPLPTQLLRLDYADMVLVYASSPQGKQRQLAERSSIEMYDVLITAWLDHYTSGRQAGLHLVDAVEKVCYLLQSAGNLYGRSEHAHDRAAVTKLLDQILHVIATSDPSLLDLQRVAAAHDDLVKSVGPSYVPSADGLGSLVVIYAKQGQLGKAERLLATMVTEHQMEPASHVYGELLNAWWQFGMNPKRENTASIIDSAEHAERHFFTMVLREHRVHDAAEHHDLATATIHRLASRVVDLWAKCHCLDGIQSLVSRILDDDGHRARIKPNTPLLTHILRAYATMHMPNDSSVAIEEAAEKADALLANMHQRNVNGDATVRPTNECYGLVIRAWGRTRRLDRIDKCLAVFDQLRSAYQAGLLGIQPNDQLYFELLKAISKEGDATNAFRLLNEMVLDYETGNVSAMPKIDTFNMVLLTCLRSHDQAAAISYGRQSYDLLTANERRFDVQANEKTFSMLAELLDDESFRHKAGHFTASLHAQRQAIGEKSIHQLRDYGASVGSAK
jgi:hypothetical protein